MLLNEILKANTIFHLKYLNQLICACVNEADPPTAERLTWNFHHSFEPLMEADPKGVPHLWSTWNEGSILPSVVW